MDYPTINGSNPVVLMMAFLDALEKVYFPSEKCNYNIIAYRFEEGFEDYALVFFSETSSCSGSPDDYTFPRLIVSIKSAILYDWNNVLSTLPDLLYPCLRNAKVWDSAWTIVWDILTTVFAFLGPMLAATILALQTIQRRREEGRQSPLLTPDRVGQGEILLLSTNNPSRGEETV
ncbi:hypothetical protein DL93DRAFT_2174575 [Clavulina sp. PMI_390]|nr:hypothetical protein DL93DRAFT_2174575 [Clavulina sp. PMI_390]